MQYKYETHLHTYEGSACASTHLKDYPKFLKERGYTGYFITDHFFNSNTRFAHDLPWEEKVMGIKRIYEESLEAAAKYSLDVFCGWEYDGGQFAHIITLGLPPEWLLEHPETMTMEDWKYCELVKASGGYLIHAHPLRSKTRISLYPYHVDGVEILNASQDAVVNGNAKIYSEMFSLPVTAGSDIHHIDDPNCRRCGVISETRFKSAADYVNAVKNGTLTLFDSSVDKDM